MTLRPCLEPGCPNLTRTTRCPGHQQQRDRARNTTRVHYHGDYETRAAQVRAAANADPTTTCRRCGQTARTDDPWQAGHIEDGDPASPLAPEHRSCNAAAGAALTNARRR